MPRTTTSPTTTTGRRFRGAAVIATLALVAVSGCSSGNDADDATPATTDTGSADTPGDEGDTGEATGDGSDTTEEASDDATTDSATTDQSAEQVEVELPTLAEFGECGGDARPCSWEDADETVLDRSLEIGETAIASYLDGAALVDVARQIADDPDIADVFVDEHSILYRLDGGLGMWVDATDVDVTRSAPAALPEGATATPAAAPAGTPRPRDVVGDDPEQKRALVIAPYQYQFGVNDESPEVAALYGGARGYDGNVDYFSNTDDELGVGPDQFRNWDQYDVVHVSTHGSQVCDAGGCETMLYVGKSYVSKEILFGENGGTTVSFSRNGPSVVAANDFFTRTYPGGLPDTVVVLSACETGRGTELTSTFGDGVVFSWTEAVRSDFAHSSSMALHRALVETGATTERAHQVVTDAGLSSYEETVPAPTERPLGSTLVLGSDGNFHPVDGAAVGGSAAGATGDGPVIEHLDAPPPEDAPGPNTITVSLVRRTGGSGDLRVREVAWIDHPREGRVMNDGDQVRVAIRADGDYLPVSLRVEGIDPGKETGTVLRLEIDGVEMKTWTAAEGRATGRWGEWRIEDDVKLLKRIADDDEVDLRLVIDLPESGTSEHSVDQIELVCLPGTWRLRSQEFLEQIVAATGAAGDFEMKYRSGEYRISIRDDGTYTGYRDEWQFGVESPQGTLVTTIDSADPGTWTANDDRLTIDDHGGNATVTLQIETGGQLQDLPFAGTQSVGTDAISGTGTFTCEDDILTTDVQGVTAIFDYVGPAD